MSMLLLISLESKVVSHMYMFWHLQISVTQFADFSDSFQLLE